MKKTNWLLLILSILLAEFVGLSSAYFSGDNTIYTHLKQPALAPPSWIFGVVWPILYALMGIAAYRIIAHPFHSKEKSVALAVYTLQLLINFSWSIVFFRFGFFWGAVATIIFLDLLVLATHNLFIKIDRLAGYLLIPYLLWLLFATYLAISIAIINR